MSAAKTCTGCGGSGYRHYGAGWYRRCRRCKGTGSVFRLRSLAWNRLRYGSGL